MCRKEESKKYMEKIKEDPIRYEKYKEYQKKYREENKEYQKKYREQNAVKIKIQKHNYYMNNKLP